MQSVVSRVASFWPLFKTSSHLPLRLQQVGMGRTGPESRRTLRAAFDLPGAWWNSTAFRKASFVFLDQCFKAQWLHSGTSGSAPNEPGRCAHTDIVSADIAQLRARGVTDIRYEFWNRTESRLAADPEEFDFVKFEADKTRQLLLYMLRHKPDAHFYVKAGFSCIQRPVSP